MKLILRVGLCVCVSVCTRSQINAEYVGYFVCWLCVWCTFDGLSSDVNTCKAIVRERDFIYSQYNFMWNLCRFICSLKGTSMKWAHAIQTDILLRR